MVDSSYIVKLTDGAIIDILYNQSYWRMCDTCDYGSKYINEWWVKTTNHVIHVKYNNHGGYCVSENWILQLFLQNLDKIKNMSQVDLFNFITNEVREYRRKIAEKTKYEDPFLTQVQIDDDSFLPTRENLYYNWN